MNAKYGGADLERVFLRTVSLHGDDEIVVEKSNFPGLNSMGDIFVRHIGRYGLALPFIRPDYRVLDFPCGSGLALEVLEVLASHGAFTYEGRDIDRVAVQYATQVYAQHFWASFFEGDLTRPALEPEAYDTIMCIEGLEHIGVDDQHHLVGELYRALRPGGTLIISSPAPASGVTGPNPENIYHLCELTRTDFVGLLSRYFGTQVEVVSQTNIMTTGVCQLCHYAVCHK